MALKDHLEKVLLFRAVAHAKSISAATSTVHLTQPTISRSLKILEDAVGYPLFVRKITGMQLTQPGEALLSFSDRLVAEIDNVEKQMITGSDIPNRRINIGCYESLSSIFLPMALKNYAMKNPSVSIGIYTAGRSEELYYKLKRSEIDIAISLKINVPKDVLSQNLYMDRFSIFYSPNSYLLAGKKITSLKKLLEFMPLIFIPNAEVSETEDLQKIVWKNQLPTKNIIEVETFDTARAYVVSGLGAAILPEIVAQKTFSSESIIRFGNKNKPLCQFKMCSFTKSHHAEDEGIQELIGCIKKAVKAGQNRGSKF